MAELITTGLFGDANLISYYRLEGNSNDSKSSNNGTDTAITYNDANGKYGQGAGFNGSTSFISIPVAAYGNNTNQTVVGWIKATNNGAFISVQPAVANVVLVRINTTSGYVEYNHWNTLNNFFAATTANSVIANGVAFHLACVKTGTALEVFINGVSKATATITGTPRTDGTTFHIGRRVDGAEWITSSMDDIGTFNRALTATEILNLYTEKVGGNPIFFSSGGIGIS